MEADPISKISMSLQVRSYQSVLAESGAVKGTLTQCCGCLVSIPRGVRSSGINDKSGLSNPLSPGSDVTSCRTWELSLGLLPAAPAGSLCTSGGCVSQHGKLIHLRNRPLALTSCRLFNPFPGPRSLPLSSPLFPSLPPPSLPFFFLLPPD